MSGFVLMYRDAADHHLFEGDAARLGAWMWLISKACWKPTKHNVAGRTVAIERGQICASRSQLSAAWGMSPSAVERFLSRLEAEQMIGRATGQGRTIITICNYDKYQDISAEAGQATGQATGQVSTRTAPRTKTGQAAGQVSDSITNRKETEKWTSKNQTGQPTGQAPDSQPDNKRTNKQGNNIPSVSKDTSGIAREAKKEGAPKAAPEFACPDGVDPVDWLSLIANRKAQRAPMTEGAYRQIITKLERWSREGWPPGPIVAHAVERGWRTVFETDEMKGVRHGDTGRSSGNRRTQELDGFGKALRSGHSLGQPHPATRDGRGSPEVEGVGREAADPCPTGYL